MGTLLSGDSIATTWKDTKKMFPWLESPPKLSWFKRAKSTLSPSIKTSSGSRENKVAYLDGVRGFAAFIVYCIHHTAFTHGPPEKRLNHSFGFRNEYHFGTLPVIRLFFNGGAFAVALFFVISGYALSLGPLTLLHNQRPGEGLRLCTQLGASLPRRWLRLYLPVIVTTFLFMTSWHVFNYRSSRVAPMATYPQELGKWFDEFREGSYVFLQSDHPAFGHNDYNHHMWSIAVEFRGSLVVYFTILAYFALGYASAARFYAYVGLFFYFHYVVDGPYYALFVMGMLLCDLDLANDLNPDQLPRILRSNILQKHRWIAYILFAAGVYLGGAPLVTDAKSFATEPGWWTLSWFLPYTSKIGWWHYCVYGAALCVFCIPRISWLRNFFESPALQYIGKISFGFYLVHGPVMWSIGDRVYAAVGRPGARAAERVPGWINLFPIPNRGPLGLELNALVPHIILLPVTIWFAVLVTKLVDTPSLKLSKHLFKTQSQKAVLTEKPETEALLPTAYTDHGR